MDDREISVELGPRSYNINVGCGLLDRAARYLPDGGWRKAYVITDSVVGPLYLGRLAGVLAGEGLDVDSFEVAAGERSKSAQAALEVLGRITDARLSRRDLVIALGGGVVGDLAGFVASVYKRGVPIAQVPTTLMSQVDSAIGGKTGVDLPQGKNLMGTFHQPVAVISDIETLATLEPREFRSGLAEIAKYRFLFPETATWTQSEATPGLLARDTGVLQEVVAGCSRAKASVVVADEFDKGQRAVLNYGHTLGHALEAATGYGDVYTHGEAVSVGMVFAAMVSEQLGVGDGSLVERHREALDALGLPVRPFEEAPAFEEVMRVLCHDKKSTGDVTMVLMESEGRPILMTDIDTRALGLCYRRLNGEE